MADGTMPVMAATSMTVVTAASETEECSGGGRGHGKVCSDESGVRGLSENAKAIWQFYLPAFYLPATCHVVDAVLKHGWPSAPCHRTKNNLKPLH